MPLTRQKPPGTTDQPGMDPKDTCLTGTSYRYLPALLTEYLPALLTATQEVPVFLYNPIRKRNKQMSPGKRPDRNRAMVRL